MPCLGGCPGLGANPGFGEVPGLGGRPGFGLRSGFAAETGLSGGIGLAVPPAACQFSPNLWFISATRAPTIGFSFFLSFACFPTPASLGPTVLPAVLPGVMLIGSLAFFTSLSSFHGGDGTLPFDSA